MTEQELWDFLSKHKRAIVRRANKGNSFARMVLIAIGAYRQEPKRYRQKELINAVITYKENRTTPKASRVE